MSTGAQLLKGRFESCRSKENGIAPNAVRNADGLIPPVRQINKERRIMHMYERKHFKSVFDAIRYMKANGINNDRLLYIASKRKTCELVYKAS